MTISNFNSEVRQASLRQKLGQSPLSVTISTPVCAHTSILFPKTWFPTPSDPGNRVTGWKWAVSKERYRATKQEGATNSIAFPFGADLHKLLYSDPDLEAIFSKYPKYFPDLIAACKDWKTKSIEQFFEECIYQLKMRPWEITFLLQDVGKLITSEEYDSIFEMQIVADYPDSKSASLFLEEPTGFEESEEEEVFPVNSIPESAAKRVASFEIDSDAKRSKVIFHL